MKLSEIVIGLGVFITSLFPNVGNAQTNSEVLFKTIDPLVKVVGDPHSEAPVYAACDTALVARGEYATVQFLIYTKEAADVTAIKVQAPVKGATALTEVSVGKVGYVSIGHPVASRLQPEGIRSVANRYPDPVFPVSSFQLHPRIPEMVRLSVHIPLTADAGLYTGSVELLLNMNGRTQRIRHPFYIKVYRSKVEKTSLLISNWFWAAPGQLRFLNNGITPQAFSARYWELMKVVASFVAAYNQNVALISPIDLLQFEKRNGKYRFDFSRFDRMVEIYQQAGVSKRIEGNPIATRSKGDWKSEFGIYVPIGNSSVDGMRKELLPAGDPKATDFLRQFLPEFWKHLKSKGWSDRFMLHVADEPIPENVDSYRQIAALVRKFVPDMKIIEAVMDNDIAGYVDVWVPKLDNLQKNYPYLLQQASGPQKELWFYTCNDPVGPYANRYIEQQLILTRLTHWLNFKYVMPGFLHWGLAAWDHISKKGTPESLLDETSASYLPAGDAWIAYPALNKLYPSIRLQTMRDGIYDYELLKMLERKNPWQAFSIASRMVAGFNNYNQDLKDFRSARRDLLEALEN